VPHCIMMSFGRPAADMPLLVDRGKTYPYCGSVRCWKNNCANGGFTVQRQKSSSGKLNSGNADYIGKKDLTPTQRLDLQNIVQLVGEMFDLIADGENIYLTIGANKERTQFLITVVDNGDRRYAAGGHLAEVAKAVTSDLL
jgi:hypothetical protein